MAALFWIMASAYGVGALGALLVPGARAARAAGALGAAVGAAAGMALAARVLAEDAALALSAPGLLSVAGGFALHLDDLGAVFLGLVSLVALPAALYGAGDEDNGRAQGALLALFLLSMSLVPLADNVVTFLAAWEAMSLTSYFLVTADAAEDEEARAAGAWYLGMTQVGVAFLLGAFLLLAAASAGTGFAQMRVAALSPGARSAVFLLAVAGFGAKAGLIPLHVWLPRAHPAAPSHVSALMSGAMIKLGVYGLLRVGLDLLGAGPLWWGTLLLGLGALSAVLGVLYALTEDDLKRLLAYSSVENIGIITLGVGAGFVFRALGQPAAAALALGAAVYHALNHAAFKGLLFLAAGAVAHATGTRNMNRLGGLVRSMPWTAPLFLVGALAIAGLPPLNGFVSEWLLFQSLLPGIANPRPLVAVGMVLAVGMLALTAGLAAACFVKAFGITFLAIPRSDEARGAHEAPRVQRAAMLLLAAVCVALGLGAYPVLPTLVSAVGRLAGAPAAVPELRFGLWIEAPAAFAQMSPALVSLGVVLVVLLTWLAVRLTAWRRPARVGETWGCGRVAQTPRMEYTSTAFAEPLRRVFAEIYRPTQDLTIDVHAGTRYVVRGIAYRSEILPWFERYLYAPALALVVRWAGHAQAIQLGSVHAYLAYLVVTLLALLGLLTVSRP